MAKAKREERDRLGELIASFNDDLLGEGFAEQIEEAGLKIERILLEMESPAMRGTNNLTINSVFTRSARPPIARQIKRKEASSC